MESQNSSDNLKQRTARGLFWSVFGNGTQQVVTMLIGIVLARLLDVSDYGLVAMLTVYSIVAGNLQESGFTSALAIRREAGHRDFNAVFWFSILVSGVIYVTLYVAAPWIAAYNNAPELTLLGRVIFLGFFFSSFGTAQAAWLFRHLMVREKTTSQVIASLVSGVTGVTAACCGAGVWALVAMDLTYKFTYTAMVWYWSPWRPTLTIDLRPAFEMFGFGVKILLTNIMNTVNNQLLQSILGHFYQPQQVGHYSQANKWNTLGHSLLGGMIGSVAQPVLARVQDDKMRQIRVFRKMLQFTALIAFPCMFGLSLIADFVPLLIGAKWAFCVPYLRVLALGGAFIPVNQVLSNLLVSKARSDLYLMTTLGFLLCQLALLLYYAGDGRLMPLLVSISLLQPLWFVVLWGVVRTQLRVGLLQVLSDILPFLLTAALSCLLAYGVSVMCCGTAESLWHNLLSIAVRIVLTATAYLGVMYVLRIAVFRECWEYVRGKF